MEVPHEHRRDFPHFFGSYSTRLQPINQLHLAELFFKIVRSLIPTGSHMYPGSRVGIGLSKYVNTCMRICMLHVLTRIVQPPAEAKPIETSQNYKLGGAF